MTPAIHFNHVFSPAFFDGAKGHAPAGGRAQGQMESKTTVQLPSL
jgi:hypothetical protein